MVALDVIQSLLTLLSCVAPFASHCWCSKLEVMKARKTIVVMEKMRETLADDVSQRIVVVLEV